MEIARPLPEPRLWFGLVRIFLKPVLEHELNRWIWFLTGIEPLQPNFAQEPIRKTAERGSFQSGRLVLALSILRIGQLFHYYRWLRISYLRFTNPKLPKGFLRSMIDKICIWIPYDEVWRFWVRISETV